MGRTPCSHKRGLKKGTWTPEEDNQLVSYITKYGHRNWRQLPKFAGLDRCGKSCRLRWMNYLRPGINRGNYTQEEEEIIVKLHSMFGNRWSLIASHLPGRSDNGIKNHWHAHLKKRFQHTSVTTNDENVTDIEASKSKHHQSPVESIQQKDLGEIDPFQNINSPATCQIPDDSPISSSLQTPLSDIFCTAPLISDENSVLDDLANFLDTDTDPISAYSWTELYAADISYFPNELYWHLS